MQAISDFAIENYATNIDLVIERLNAFASSGGNTQKKVIYRKDDEYMEFLPMLVYLEEDTCPNMVRLIKAVLDIGVTKKEASKALVQFYNWHVGHFTEESFEVVKLFLQHGADPSFVYEKEYDNSCLHILCANKMEDYSLRHLELLLQNGADPNIELGSYQYATPLHLVQDPPEFGPHHYGENSILATKLLVKHGANINARDELGMTPLHRLLGNMNSGEEKYSEEEKKCFESTLLDLGADKSIADNEGRLPSWDFVLDKEKREPYDAKEGLM